MGLQERPVILLQKSRGAMMLIFQLVLSKRPLTLFFIILCKKNIGGRENEKIYYFSFSF